jgi:hypothetical protein
MLHSFHETCCRTLGHDERSEECSKGTTSTIAVLCNSNNNVQFFLRTPNFAPTGLFSHFGALLRSTLVGAVLCCGTELGRSRPSLENCQRFYWWSGSVESCPPLRSTPTRDRQSSDTLLWRDFWDTTGCQNSTG